MRAANVLAHKQTWRKQGPLCPGCPPEGPTVGSHVSLPDRDPGRKHSVVSRNSAFLVICMEVGEVGGGVGPPSQAGGILAL